MPEIGKHSNHLVLISKSCDKWTNSMTATEIMEKFELVLNPYWRASNVNLL